MGAKSKSKAHAKKAPEVKQHKSKASESHAKTMAIIPKIAKNKCSEHQSKQNKASAPDNDGFHDQMKAANDNLKELTKLIASKAGWAGGAVDLKSSEKLEEMKLKEKEAERESERAAKKEEVMNKESERTAKEAAKAAKDAAEQKLEESEKETERQAKQDAKGGKVEKKVK